MKLIKKVRIANGMKCALYLAMLSVLTVVPLGTLQATLFDPDDAVFVASSGSCALPVCPSPSEVTYDATTDQFNTSNDSGGLIDFAPNGIVDVSDVIGNFSLTATIDGTGTLTSGSYSWTGSSATLGIGSPTLLLSGSLSQVETDIFGGGVFQFLGTPDFIHPVIDALAQPFNVVGLRYAGVDVTPEFAATPWQVDLPAGLGVFASPDLFGFQVPEPGTLALFGLGLAGLGFARRRRAA